MTSFLLSIGGTSEMPEDPPSDERCQRLGSLGILRWQGGPSGDVAVSVDEQETTLVVAGYVADGLGFTGGLDAQRNAAVLHRAFQRHRTDGELPRFLTSLHGSFALLLFDPVDASVTVVTDRIASRPVYVQESANRILLASSGVSIAEERGEAAFDLGGLASYLLYGTQVDPSRTIFDRVRSQPEGTAVKYCVGLPPVTSRWYQYEHRPEEGRTIDEWTRDAEGALTAAASRVAKVSRAPPPRPKFQQDCSI